MTLVGVEELLSFQVEVEVFQDLNIAKYAAFKCFIYNQLNTLHGDIYNEERKIKGHNKRHNKKLKIVPNIFVRFD